jgi:hypothetical protein
MSSSRGAPGSYVLGGHVGETRHTRLVDQSSSSGTGGAHTNTDYNTEDTATTLTNGSNHKPVNVFANNMDMSMTAAGVASVAAAATAAAKAEKLANRPKISYEVRPFTKESLEKINIRTSNLIRDYGFLPKRKPNLLDGAELPAKYEPFPIELLGRPVEEIDQYVYEKVGLTSRQSHSFFRFDDFFLALLINSAGKQVPNRTKAPIPI